MDEPRYSAMARRQVRNGGGLPHYRSGSIAPLERPVLRCASSMHTAYPT